MAVFPHLVPAKFVIGHKQTHAVYDTYYDKQSSYSIMAYSLIIAESYSYMSVFTKNTFYDQTMMQQAKLHHKKHYNIIFIMHIFDHKHL